MHNTGKYGPFVFATTVLMVAVYLLFPFCQYYIDPDATSYLTIARRYADGDYLRAVNGYWSPWSCWLVAVLIKAGVSPMPAAIVINTLAGVGWLAITQSLFTLFSFKKRIQYLFLLSLAAFLAYATYYQNFADLWEVLFLLCSLRLMLTDGFLQRPGLWLVNGLLGTLAYFAKAYAFPFFMLHTICCGIYLAKTTGAGRQWIKMSAVSILAMLVCSSPWIYLLHWKYGAWMTSTAGKLNASWYLVGHPYWKESINVLLPPVYSDSPYYWEDPYIANGDTPGFLSSGKLFLLQIAKIAYNAFKFLKATSQISIVLLLVWLLALASFVSQKYRHVFPHKARVVVLSFLLFPLGFIIINYEARYIWYMLPLSMLLGALALQHYQHTRWGKRVQLLVVLLALTYIVYPLWDMQHIINRGRKEYAIGQQMKQVGISGSFTTNIPQGPFTQEIARIAYFSGNSYYMMPFEGGAPQNTLLADMRRYKVKYYLSYRAAGETEPFTNEQGTPFPEVTGGKIPGVKIFLVNP